MYQIIFDLSSEHVAYEAVRLSCLQTAAISIKMLYLLITYNEYK